MSLNLFSDVEWPIWMQEEGKDAEPVVMKPGDAVLYNGTNVLHWRESFPGQACIQAFLHYVRTNGPNREEMFDRMMIIEKTKRG
jgi:hypothetical protein